MARSAASPSELPEYHPAKPLEERRLVVPGLRLALLVIVLGIWEAVARLGIIDPFFTGQPTGVAAKLVSWVADGSIFLNTWVTVAEATIGFAISAVLGIALGLLLARYRLLDAVTYPFVDVLNSLPRMALAPLFALWFGLGIGGKVVLVVSVALFNFMINTYTGAKSVDPEYTKLARILGANRRQMIRTIIMPSIAPWVIAAMRFAVAYSLAAAVIAEIVAANHGLGYLIAFTSGVLDTNGQFAALVVLAIVAWVANTGVARLERRLLRWQNPQ